MSGQFDIVSYIQLITPSSHKEVASLAIFLDHYFDGKEFELNFKGKKNIIGVEKGKKVLES